MKQLLVFSTIILAFKFTIAQQSNEIPFFAIKANYFRIEEGQEITTFNMFGANANYRLKPYWDLGCIFAYGSHDFYKSGIAIKGYERIFNFALNTNLHVLPLITHTAKTKPEVYIGAQIGGFYTGTKEANNTIDKFKPNYGVYAGLAYHFKKRLGIYIEPGIYYFNEKELSARVGLTWRFL